MVIEMGGTIFRAVILSGAVRVVFVEHLSPIVVAGHVNTRRMGWRWKRYAYVKE